MLSSLGEPTTHPPPAPPGMLRVWEFLLGARLATSRSEQLGACGGYDLWQHPLCLVLRRPGRYSPRLLGGESTLRISLRTLQITPWQDNEYSSREGLVSTLWALRTLKPSGIFLVGAVMSLRSPTPRGGPQRSVIVTMADNGSQLPRFFWGLPLADRSLLSKRLGPL